MFHSCEDEPPKPKAVAAPIKEEPMFLSQYDIALAFNEN
jgi:hypothetical protein